MKSSNKELIELVQIVLETYKIKEKGIKLLKENIKLNGFINGIIDDITPFAAMSGIRVNFNPSRDIKVTADPIQLQRVIKNLINNAISHSNTKKTLTLQPAKSRAL